MSAPVNEGDVLAGKYRVDKVLGIGGMGVVVAAYHLQLDEKVALKFLLPEMLVNAEAVGRFEREARAAVKIKSEHVARVSDVGKLENGSPYMVMEYLDGGDLSAWLEQRGALPVEQAVEFMLQACEALAEAHALGIVHRDLKPANLFCIRRADGLLSIKVLDFGISKVSALGGSGADMSMTKTQAMMGSPLYMSPEQMQSAKNADARSDIWALGVILYELLTGQVPFNGEGLPELVLNVVSSQPVPMRNLRPDLPEGLEPVVLRCLEKNREQRYSNVAELAVALAPFAPMRARGSIERVSRLIETAGLSKSALSLALPASSGATAMGTVGSWGQTKPGKSGTKKALVGGAVVAGLLAVALVAVLLVRRSPEGDSATASTGAPTALVPTATTPATPASAAVAPANIPEPVPTADAAKPDAAAATSVAAPSAPPASDKPTKGASRATPPAAKPNVTVTTPPKAQPKAPATPPPTTPPPTTPKYNPLDHL